VPTLSGRLRLGKTIAADFEHRPASCIHWPTIGGIHRKFFIYSVRGILVTAVVLAAVAFWQREKINRLVAVNSLFSLGEIVINFCHMDTIFLSRSNA